MIHSKLTPLKAVDISIAVTVVMYALKPFEIYQTLSATSDSVLITKNGAH